MRDHRRLRGKARSVKRKTEASWPSCARRATHSDPRHFLKIFFFLLPRCRGTNTALASDSVKKKKLNLNMFAATFLHKLCTGG